MYLVTGPVVKLILTFSWTFKYDFIASSKKKWKADVF